MAKETEFKRKQIVIVSNPSQDNECWVRYFDKYAPELFAHHPYWDTNGSCWEQCQPLDAYTSEMNLRSHIYLDDAKLIKTFNQLTGDNHD